MATTAASILDALGEAARQSSDHSADSVDAECALARLGEVLKRLAADGLTADGAPERERWVSETGRACVTAAAVTAIRDTGRLAQLSAAAADTVSILREGLGCENRWAFATAIVDVVGPLIEVVERGEPPIDRQRALIVADAAATIVARSAALDPPSAAACVPLEWAVPSPVPNPSGPAADVIANAIGGVEYSTRPLGETAVSLSVADYLAVCTAVETLSRSTADVTPFDDAELRDASLRCGQGWAAARAALNPFDDGSRRPQIAVPPPVRYALTLHDAVRSVTHASSTNLRRQADTIICSAAVRDAVQRVPAIAEHLQAALTEWAETGRLLAYARDFAPRDTRVPEYLVGFRGAGLITADATDLTSARDALAGARLLSVELAARAAERRSTASTVPRLSAANRNLLSQVTNDRLRSATRDAQRALATNTGPPRGGRGPHR